MEVRAAVHEDISKIFDLIKDQTNEEVTVAHKEALARDGFVEHSLFECFLCEVNSVLMGCVLHTRLYSTWEGRMMFICGLFIRPCANKEEVMKTLLRQCAVAAVASDCCRCDLILSRDDTLSISWYSELGAMSLNEWIGVWFSRSTLADFISTKEETAKQVKTKYNIRPACKEDVESILYLIQVLAEFEKEPYALKITGKELLRDGFSRNPYYSCFVAVSHGPSSTRISQANSGQPSDSMPHDSAIVSYALYLITYSTMEGSVLHLEDLFVHSDHRGQGLGTVMMRECAQVALANGCTRMQLNVLDWNTKARDLYVHIGGVCRHDLLQMRFHRPALESLAAEIQQNVI